jgi:hypothetical protein
MFKRLCVLLVLALSMLASAAAARAQDGPILIAIDPWKGPPGTSVTITGSGATPGAELELVAIPHLRSVPCSQVQPVAAFATVQAGSDGRFAAVHVVQRASADQAGYAYLVRPAGGTATSNRACFTFADVAAKVFPETGHTVGGRFLDYWQANGGLPVFGYPLTERQEHDGRTIQTFERHRFEHHADNAPPYDVLLSRLGAVMLQWRGIHWQRDIPPAAPAPGCLFFEQTRHNVCDQGIDGGFRSFWSGHGQEFDGRSGSSYDESLALWGYPLTEAYLETSSDGTLVLTQWFERARFEWHPDNPAPYRVLLGRLAADLLAAYETIGQ